MPPAEDPTRQQFLMYLMTAKLCKLGKTPAQIFNMMDQDGGGHLDHEEFIQGMQ